MKLQSVDIRQSPDSSQLVRLTGVVSYDDAPSCQEEYWFEVPCIYSEALSASGNPWLVFLLPLAVTLGEPLRIELPVDRTLLRNVHELMLVWHQWYRDLNAIKIDAQICECLPPRNFAKTAAFFSGGVDGLFTLLSHEVDESAWAGKIDDLLLIRGFDIPLDNVEAFDRLSRRLMKVSDKLGKSLVCISTNLRENRFKEADWGKLSHGGALASCGLALENRYSEIFIGSTGGYYDLDYWGSHVITDPLLSTSSVQVRNDGGGYTRLEKTRFVADFELAREMLHVCYHDKSDDNCCECEKCIRTMAALECLGKLSEFQTFKRRPFDARMIESFLWRTFYSKQYIEDIRDLAESVGRRDIVSSINKSLRSSAIINFCLPNVWRLRHFRALFPLASALERILLRGRTPI